MTINPFSTELAAQHRRDLLRHADDYHRAKAARPIRRSGRVGRRMLRIRPAPKRWLTLGEMLEFTDVDHHNHEALIALTLLRGQPVGVARFIRNVDDPKAARARCENNAHSAGCAS